MNSNIHNESHHYSERELGIMQAMITDFVDHRIPRLLSIESEMVKGELISELDLIFLKDCLELSRATPEFAERHTEYKSLVSKIVSLYHHITELALKNEKSK